jgi:hypothetical protein
MGSMMRRGISVYIYMLRISDYGLQAIRYYGISDYLCAGIGQLAITQLAITRYGW